MDTTSSAKMFPDSSATVSPSRSVALFPENTAKTSPPRTVEKYPSKIVIRSPKSLATKFLGLSRASTPRLSVPQLMLKNVLQDMDINVLSFYLEPYFINKYLLLKKKKK